MTKALGSQSITPSNGRQENLEDLSKFRPKMTGKTTMEDGSDGDGDLINTDEESAMVDDEVLTEISTEEAELQLANLLKGDINDEKVFKLLNHMVSNGYPVEKIEEVLW